MSFRVEIEHADAELLALLKQRGVALVQNWDVTVRDGVTMKVTVSYPTNATIPAGAIDAINTCVKDVVAAFKS